ncbi:BCCT family transporter-domain-containing protein [Pelagophyceae sp. CCMP2097]|nr:BCCT family transporter-domain-containing protein [Pelagophyceae sp. CCMP2097]
MVAIAAPEQRDTAPKLWGRGITLPFVEGFVGTPFYYNFNPYVTLYAVALIWGFVIYTISSTSESYKEFQTWFHWVTDEWTWLYILSQNIWIVLLLWICCSKYRHIKFGADDDEPEYSNVQWFAMLFCCGVAVGLFYYGVAEPMWHYEGYGGSRFGEMADTERATHALMITYFHWGLHGWVPYSIVGATLSILHYRRGLPLTLRSLFYPLWGKLIEGWRGDVVDVMGVCCTLFGVCTSLGLGVQQLNQGLVRLDRGTYAGVDAFGEEWDNPPSNCVEGQCRKGMLGIKYSTKTQVVIIWFVTLLATCSVLAGLNRGIACLSYLAFSMGLILMMSVLFMDDTMFILDALTSSIGYYMWYLPKLSFETDAWARLGGDHTWSRNGDGVAASIAVQGDVGGPDGRGGGENWMHTWTIFYWGWWISWAPFVGTFLARISKGRKLGEFIMYTMILPSLYSILWMGIFGSAGIKMQFENAHNQGGDCGFTATGRSTRMEDHSMEAKHNQAYTVNLYCLSTEDILFDQLGSYGSRQFAYALTGFAWVCLLIYFITSSDSGSYVIDILAANGNPEPPMFQRTFWACTEGAAATALLVGSGADSTRSIKALQAVSVVSGLPLTFVLMYVSHALYVCIQEEVGDLDEDRPDFRTTILSISSIFSGEFRSTPCEIFEYVFMPFMSVKKAWARIHKESANLYMVGSFLTFATTVTFLSMSRIEANLRMVSAAFYLAFACIVAAARNSTRQHLAVQKGDALSDVCIAILFYPLALAHMDRELKMGVVQPMQPPLYDAEADEESKAMEKKDPSGVQVVHAKGI